MRPQRPGFSFVELVAAMVVLAIIIGGISSHMPGKYRYYSIWHGRVIKE